MSEPQGSKEPFDDGLEALFDRAAARTPDDGFSEALFHRLGRRARIRVVTVTVAGVLGAAVAVSQIGNLVELYASKARALASLLPREETIVDAANAASTGNFAMMLAVLGALGLMAASGALVLGRR